MAATIMSPEELGSLSSQNISKRISEQEKNLEYLEKNIAQLIDQHVEEWIFVRRGTMVACADSTECLLQRLSTIKSPSTLLFYIRGPSRHLLL